MRTSTIILTFALVNLSLLCACHRIQKSSINENEQTGMHSAYDDSTLNNRVLPVMMPYNRLIDPAGKTLRFGDPALENHSLTVKLIPNSPLLVVEGRFAITLIDTTTDKTVAEWAYKNDRKLNGLMSTYSGLAVRKTGSEVQLFWSAANGGNQRSYVLQANGTVKTSALKTLLLLNPKRRLRWHCPMNWPFIPKMVKTIYMSF